MASVIVKTLGARPRDVDGVRTVGDVRTKEGIDPSLMVRVNNEEAEDSRQLDDGDAVTFAPKVKGG